MKKSARIFTIVCLLILTSSAFAQTTKTLILRPGPQDGTDADIRTDMPRTPNGNSPDFIANAWTAQGNYFVQRSLLKFDLSQIPVEATVLNATLFLYTNLTTGHHQLDSGANAAILLRATQPWTEDQVYWDNQPAASDPDPVYLPQSTSHTQNYEVNVTSHVSAMVANPTNNYGWLFKLQVEEKYRCMVFASSDHPVAEWRPKLVIQYTDCQVPVAGFSYFVNSPDVKFTDTSSNATSWNWTFGDETSSTQQNPLHRYAFPGRYPVCLVVSNSCGNASVCDTVEVPCVPPEVSFAYSNDHTLVSFMDTSYSFNPDSRLWDFGDGTTSTLHNPVHDFVESGIYNVCYTATDTCGTDVQCDRVMVSSLLIPAFSASQTEIDGLTVSFNDCSVGAKAWQWDFGDGTSSVDQNPVHTYKQYGVYKVCLYVHNNIISLTGCDTIIIIRGKNSSNISSIIFYPNPSPGTGKVSFAIFEDSPLVSITIFDFEGRKIWTGSYTNVGSNMPVEMDVRGLGKGTYLVSGSFNNYKKITKLEIF